MTTEPSPDPRDVLAQVRAIGLHHRPASVSVERDSVTCQCGVESSNHDGLEEHRAELIVAAVLDVADALITGHTDAILAALTRAGVLTVKYAVRDNETGDIWLDAHGPGDEAKAGGLEQDDGEMVAHLSVDPYETAVTRLVTPWREAPE